MRKDTQAVLLLLVGATLLKIVFAGTYVRYVRTGFAPLLVLAGAVLVAVAGVALWHAMRRPRPADVSRHDGSGGAGSGGAGPGSAGPGGAGPGGADDHDAGDHGDGLIGGHGGWLKGGHGGDALGRQGEPRAGWLILLPVLALLLLVPPALGSHQASRTGTGVSLWAGADLAPLPPADPVRMALRDYAARAVRDQGQSLAGRRVVLSGFVIAGPGGRPYLARMVVGCCAADARPVKIGLAGDVPPDLVADQWVEVEGAFTDQRDRDPVNRDIIPYLQVVELRPIGAPDQPYES